MKSPGRSWLAMACLALAGAWLTGCQAARSATTPEEREAIHRRAAQVFAFARLFKPPESLANGSLGVELAPLFVQEVAGQNAAVAQPRPPEVTFREEEVWIAGTARRQVSFRWRKPGGRFQQLCITLNGNGLPAVWEVRDDESRARLFFVSQSLETAAIREFQGPLPGCRFAVERDRDKTPEVVVVQVLEDAPVAMGPVVHLDIRGIVTSVSCRCMPTQARQLEAAATYKLKPPTGVAKKSKPIPGTKPSLAGSLRLPASF